MNRLFLTKDVTETPRLGRVLGRTALIFAGIGNTIGAGIFVLIGVVTVKTGGAVVLSLVIAGIVAMLTALCYAEFASFVPSAGSAYAYIYRSLGEFPAWIVGWTIVLEFTVGCAALARGWSGYTVSLLQNFSSELTNEWVEIPISGTPFSFSFIAPLIIIVLGVITTLGVEESSTANIILCSTKIMVLLIVIVGGLSLANFDNWSADLFMPEGIGAVFAGAGTLLFAYAGFDILTTLAEDAIDPKTDMPIALIVTSVVAMVLYVGTGAALTLMMPYNKIDTHAPLSDAFSKHGLEWVSFLISIGAFAGISSAMLIFALGQTRIWFALSADGLLPAPLSKIHPVYRTPYVAAIMACGSSAIVGMFLELEALAKLLAIGTLFAFAAVATCLLLLRCNFHPVGKASTAAMWVGTLMTDVTFFLPAFPNAVSAAMLFLLFVGSAAVLHFFAPSTHDFGSSFRVKGGPIVPCLSIVSNLSVMASLGLAVWVRFVVWLVIGVAVYFFYGIKHSKVQQLAGFSQPTPRAPQDENTSLLGSNNNAGNSTPKEA